MNVHSLLRTMPQIPAEPSLDRRSQILEAAMLCFAKHGFHQTSMHDISAEAGISVGLIYRYFKNKEEVIAALAAEHKKDIADLIFALRDGAMMRSVFPSSGSSIARQRERQLNVARTLWRLLFSRTSHANGHN